MLHGKGDKARVVGLDAGARAIVQLWLDRRAASGDDENLGCYVGE